jgi:hypothetical protein
MISLTKITNFSTLLNYPNNASRESKFIAVCQSTESLRYLKNGTGLEAQGQWNLEMAIWQHISTKKAIHYHRIRLDVNSYCCMAWHWSTGIDTHCNVLCGQPMGNALLHQTNVHSHSQCLS